MVGRSMLVVMATAGVLATAQAPAFAQNGPPDPPNIPGGFPGGLPGGLPLAPCAPGQEPTEETPCDPGAPVFCPDGQEPSEDFPCIPTPTDGGGGGGDDESGPGGPGGGNPGDGPPDLLPGFLNKVWRFTADADSYDAASNTLNCTITKILNLPKRFRNQDDDIVDADAFVLFSATTKVFDNHGRRVRLETRYDGLLDDADSVKVVGKVIPPRKWKKDEDDTPAPTIRAKRVTITG